jgi:hypothetical protein
MTRLDGFLAEQAHLRKRFGFRLRLDLLVRALLAANARKRLPQIGFDAVGVTKRTVEDRFHKMSFLTVALHPRPLRPANAKYLPLGKTI